MERQYERRLEEPAETAVSVPPDQVETGRVIDERPAGPPETIELREEGLVARRQREQVGEVRVRTVVEEVPSRVTADVTHDEVVVERIPVNQEVDQRYPPWQEEGAQVMPVYEEELILVKRLILKEKVVVRRVPVTENRPIETTLRRERLVVESPREGLVREIGPEPPGAEEVDEDRPGPFDRVVRKIIS